MKGGGIYYTTCIIIIIREKCLNNSNEMRVRKEKSSFVVVPMKE